jgi:2-polyprenyl-3-methyl-5-hydroxy-6-metoxy-1,4-benzoquinol methylase
MPEGASDLVFLWHSLEDMDDPQLVMQRVRELLAPEGVLILAVPS